MADLHHAGIVHQDVNATQRPARLGHQAIGRARRRQIEGKGDMAGCSRSGSARASALRRRIAARGRHLGEAIKDALRG